MSVTIIFVDRGEGQMHRLVPVGRTAWGTDAARVRVLLCPMASRSVWEHDVAWDAVGSVLCA